jgi:NADPH:quinone reductase-like Zn-dependent oxidoreductase
VQAIVRDRYCGPDGLELREAEAPTPAEGRVLVRVRAASVNPYDWHVMRGDPCLVRLMMGLRRPSSPLLGADLAGVVEAVGPNVTQFRPGDEVFGSGEGAFAELATAAEGRLAPKPAGLSFEQAAAIPIAGCTALQGLRDTGGLEAGQRVLVNGAAGGVGTFGVQIAKALGAEVTGVCSTGNVEVVRSLGADRVLDYTQEDFTRTGPFDLIFDVVGNRSLAELRGALTPTGTLVSIGAGTGRLLGGLGGALWIVVVSRFVKQKLTFFVAKIDTADLTTVAELTTPVVGRVYPLAETVEAIRYVETKHARGKVIVTVEA